MDSIVNTEISTFAANLRKHRERAFPGWGGLGCFAKAAGVSPDALARWMSGKQMPSTARIHTLSKALGVSVGELCSPQVSETETSGDAPESVQEQIAAIDTVILLLTYHKRALLGEVDAGHSKEGFRIISELLKRELE